MFFLDVFFLLELNYFILGDVIPPFRICSQSEPVLIHEKKIYKKEKI